MAHATPLMRIALVAPEHGWKNPAFPTTATLARAIVDAGHEVLVLHDRATPVEPNPATPADTRTAAPALHWCPIASPRARHRYFVSAHARADALHDTVLDLSANHRLDLVDVLGDPADALTVLRARRLLRAGRRLPPVVVRDHPDPPAARGSEAGAFDGALREARRYGLQHADAVVREPAMVLGPLPASARPRPAGRPQVGRTVCRLGGRVDSPEFDAFVRAAAIVHERYPDVRYVLLLPDHRDRASIGDDEADAMRAFRRRFPPTAPPPVQWRTVGAEDVHRLVADGALTLLADGPTGLLPTVAAGHLPLLDRRTAPLAGLPEATTSALAVDVGDPEDLAKAMLSHLEIPEHASSLLEDVQQHVAAHHHPAVLADRLLQRYRAVVAEETNQERDRPKGRRAMDRVSVVIPVFNQGRYLHDAVASARAAAPLCPEIVIVDDGSTEQPTVDAIAALEGVVTVRQPNRGLPAARNAGIRAATGRYIVPLDADDLLPEGFLQTAVDALEANSDLAYVSGYVRNVGLLDYVYVPLGHVPGLSLVVNTFARATSVFRREALHRVNGYDERLAAFEDWDLYLRLNSNGLPGDVLPVPGQVYRRHADSMTWTATAQQRLANTMVMLERHLGGLDYGQAAEIIQTVMTLWKHGYEPSASVRSRETNLREDARRE